MSGYSFTIISAVFLGLTMIFDKVLLHKLYGDNTALPFFISTAIGSVIWLVVVPVIWYLSGDFTMLFSGALVLVSREISILGVHMPIALAVFIAGVATNQTIRHYFRCFDNNAPVVIAMVIALTPVFVFAAELTMNHTTWQPLHFMSVMVATLGMIGYEFTFVKKKVIRYSVRAFHLIMFVGYSVGYLVLIDYILATMTNEWSMGSGEATLIALPYYFLGVATGVFTIARKDVREFVKSLPRKKDFIVLLVLLEVIGEGFYFFELFGLAELNVTLVALIVGAHVVIVWLFDLWLEKRGRRIGNVNGDLIIRFFSLTFSVPRDALTESSSRYMPFVQFACIILVLLGIWLWPT